MISLAEYVGVHAHSPDWTIERASNALKLLSACARLQTLMVADKIIFHVNPKTKSMVSGETYGGFRPQDCPIGAPHSSHKEGHGVDIFDPDGKIDAWLVNNAYTLGSCGIYIEHPIKTPTWSHWQDIAPGSGHRIFYP